MNCPANVPVQVSTPQSFQAVPNPRPISSVVPVVKNEAEEKQKRYKLEQQRKFKNFSKFVHAVEDSLHEKLDIAALII